MDKINELQREKARQLRYRKPVIAGLSRWEMLTSLQDMMEAAQTVQYYWDTDEDSVVNALCGDEDDAYELKMQFSDLEAAAERMYEDFHDMEFGDIFDDFFAGSMGGNDTDMLGYDTVEEDYFPIDRWENTYATEEAQKRLERLTKKELIGMAGMCMKVFVNFVSLQTRFQSLKAALDILKGQNTEVLVQAKRINELYDTYTGNMSRSWSREAVELDRAAEQMPPEAWLA